MHIALISITYNDDYKFKEWVQHYSEHKNDIYMHIIVDNGSEQAYLNQVKEAFPDSKLIERSSNGGCTGAYNDGIRFALADPKVDAIMLLGNDIRIVEIQKLYQFLYSDDSYGMVAPVLLFKDTLDVVEDYGCEVNSFLNLVPSFIQQKLSDQMPISRIVSAVTGGMNIAKRAFYEKVGLQDENLFMYSDEVDMSIRANNAGFKLAVTKNVLSWHQHINPNHSNSRKSFSQYLIRRNKIYLGYKHFGATKALYIFIYQLFFWPYVSIFYIKNKDYKSILFYILGNLAGILKVISNFQIILSN